MIIKDSRPSGYLQTLPVHQTNETQEIYAEANKIYRSFGTSAAINNMPNPYTRLPARSASYNGVHVGSDPIGQVPIRDSAPMYYFIKDAPKQKPENHRRGMIDTDTIRKDFPILQRTVHGKPLIWLDNSATTQKPKSVIDALSHYYSNNNSNVHRGAHQLAKEATGAYEQAREKVQRFIGASSSEEVVFVRGTTEAINLVANGWGMKFLRPGDEIILTQMEHHSNIVPWQMLVKKKGARIKVAPINEKGEVMLDGYEQLFSPRTRLVAAAHVSNVLGTVNPVRQMADIAHRHGALMLVDGAQSTPHMPVNVQELDADFYAFSGHKMYGPTGIGVLYGKKALLEKMSPYQGGGGMIKDVDFNQTTYQNLPNKFEAGTGNIADAVGLGAAVDYLQSVGMEKIRQYELELTQYLMKQMRRINGVHLIGTAGEKTSVVTFILSGAEPEEIAKRLDEKGIAIRAGHHCAQPVLRQYGLEEAARASLGFYNTYEEIDKFINAISEMAGRY